MIPKSVGKVLHSFDQGDILGIGAFLALITGSYIWFGPQSVCFTSGLGVLLVMGAAKRSG